MGDEALERVGEALKEICRCPSDFAFRLGGEEFGVLATSLCEVNARAFGERTRAVIVGMEILHAHNEISDFMTVSVGLVNKVPSLDDTTETYFRVADNRLYRAKALGRNRVVASEEGDG